MKSIAPTTLALATVLAVGTVASITLRATATQPESAIQDSAAQIERGRYLVENVGMCADCHTPRTEKGAFDRSRWLLGATLPFQPTVPMPWSPAAPQIAGLPSMTAQEGIAYLQSGRRPNGSPTLPPMPEFRFSAADAAAVVAYLKSLGR